VGSACRRWSLHPARQPSHDERCGARSGDRRRVLADRRVAEVGELRSPPGRKGEGREHLGDGRRPGAAWAPVFDETASGPSLVIRGDGDAAALPDPPRVQEDVRGRVASPSAVEKTAGGRFGAEGPSIAAPPGLRRATGVIGPLGGRRDGRGNGRSWRFAVKRSSTGAGSPYLPAERPSAFRGWSPTGIERSAGCS